MPGYEEDFNEAARLEQEGDAAVTARLTSLYRAIEIFRKEMLQGNPTDLAIVGVQLERSLDLVVALLGVLKAGKFYVPLDPSYPVARLRYMMEDSQSVLLLTRRNKINGSLL